MTITHEAPTAVRMPALSLLTTIASAPWSAMLMVRAWHRDAVQKRTIAKLPAHLRRDIGEVDHIPTPTPSFTQSNPSSYQDRLQQMWLR
jgi:hypothetical protein